MIDTYINDIKKSLSEELYFSALSLALTLPDICGSVEFPNKQIHERYIKWYDNYIGSYLKEVSDKTSPGNPYLCGEVVYNLRNCFFHNGQPGIVTKKIKDESNKITKFLLFVGDSRGLQEFTISVLDMPFKAMVVDVSYLCDLICDAALYYYNENKDRFTFDYSIMTESQLFGEIKVND